MILIDKTYLLLPGIASARAGGLVINNPGALISLLVYVCIIVCVSLSGSGCAHKAPVKDILMMEESKTFELDNKTQTPLTYLFEKVDSLESESERSRGMYLLAIDYFIANGQDDKRVPEMILQKGDFFFDQALYSEAINSYKVLIYNYGNTPYYIKGLKKIALSYARNAEIKNAESWYQRLRQTGLDSLKTESRIKTAGLLFRKARDFEKEGEYNRAGAEYYKIAKSYPELDIAAKSLIQAGVMKEKLEEWNDAILIYKGFLKSFYESSLISSVLVREAACWENKKAYIDAAKKYLNIIRSFPGTVEAEESLYKAGVAFEKAGQPAIAARTFERFFELYPESKNNCEALSNAVRIYRQIKNKGKANEIQQIFIQKCESRSVKVK